MKFFCIAMASLSMLRQGLQDGVSRPSGLAETPFESKMIEIRLRETRAKSIVRSYNFFIRDFCTKNTYGNFVRSYLARNRIIEAHEI